jgi:dCMP deaminase
MIIGLTGKNGAGKGVSAEYFKRSGFAGFSLSDMIRLEVKKSGHHITRETLIETGRKLRADGGASVLAELVLEKLDVDKNYVIDSIRNPAEVKTLKRRKDFLLLCSDAEQGTLS